MPWSAAGKPTRGAWVFRNVTQSFDFWPTLESVSISQLHPDGIMALSCSVPDKTSTIDFQNSDEVRVTFEGVRIWAGHIRVPGKGIMSEHGPRVWELTGQDYTAKLDDSVILTTEGERPRESIADRVDWILSFLNFSITTANVSLPSETVEASDYDGSTVREGLQQVSDEKALHFYVDFTKDLHMFRTETIAAPFDISTSPDYSTTFPCSEFKIDDGDDIELTNAVRVKGLRHKRWVIDQDSIDEFGRQESAIIDDSLITLEQVNAAGQRRLNQLAWPIVDGSFVCYEPGLFAGMTLHIEDSRWSIDADYILTHVEITAPDGHDESGKAMLFQQVSFTDRRRVGRFPGSGKDIKEANHPGGGGGGSGGGGGGGDAPGTCCNPVPTGPNDLLAWDDSNIMGFKQGHTSGTSHSFLLPDGSGYPDGVVGGDITDRQVLLFMMTTDELPGGGGGVAVDIDPWDSVVFQVIGCTHGFAPFNNGHPNMQTRVYRLNVDLNPGEYPESGGVVVVNSDEATEVLWITVLVGGTGGLFTGPISTDWDVPTWDVNADPDVGKRALYLSVAFNRAYDHVAAGLPTGSPLFAEQHDTSIVTGIPAIVSGAEGVFTRIAAAVGGEKTIFLDYALSPINTGTLPDLDTTGYTGTSSGSQDFIITRNFALEIESSVSGSITPGPTWEGGNPLQDEGTTAGGIVVGENVVITSAATGQVWTYAAYGPPDLPTSLDDWAITQPFTLDTAGSLTDAGDRLLAFHVYIDGQFRSFEVRLGDSSHAQGVNIEGTTDHFVAKNIVEGALHYFKFLLSAGTAYAKMWAASDPEPAAWDVTTTDFATTTEADHIAYFVSIGNNGGAAMVLTLPPPTIEGMALPGESVDWEIVGYGDGSETTFPTRYPYDELSLHVRVDAQQLNGSAFTMDGAAGTITLDSAPYGDPSDPTGSSVVEARYTRT